MSKTGICAKGGVAKHMWSSPHMQSKAALKWERAPAKSKPIPPMVISRRQMQEILNDDDDNDKEFAQFLVQKDETNAAGKAPKGRKDLPSRTTACTVNMPCRSPREKEVRKRSREE